MKESNKILWDENKNAKFDFTSAIDVFEPHELANLYSNYLSDVDFVVEEEEKFWNKMTKKFYGTMFLVWACNKNPADKPVQYVLLVENNPVMDGALKKKAVMKMKVQLPFKYRDRNEIRRTVIDEFLLIDLKEWKERYPQYPICKG